MTYSNMFEAESNLSELIKKLENNVFETFTDLSFLVKLLEKGEDDVLYIAKNGVKIAKLTLLPEEERAKCINSALRDFEVPDDFDETPPNFV